MKWRLALVGVAICAAAIPMRPSFVDRFYSDGVYAALQRPITAFSNRVPFPLFDALNIVVIGAWLALALRDIARVRRAKDAKALGAAGRISARTIVWAAALYLAFLSLWGLNYRRTPLEQRLQFDDNAVTSEAALTLALTAAGQLNLLHAPAHAAGWPEPGVADPSLAASLSRAARATGGHGGVTAARPKSTLLDWYFRRTATDGMTDPYFLETLIATTLLPFERPFVIAHEWSHLAGFAQEGDANFVAWLACVQGTPPAQYSGWLFLYSELFGAVDQQARAELGARLSAGPRADLTAIRDRVARHVDPRLAAAGRQVYDRYLKANRVEEGVESYREVVRLVLGVRFGPDWEPQLR